jgi:hypothetical protein
MNISLNNIKQITQNSFEDLMYDKKDSLIQLKKFFEQENNPLGLMIHEEFNFYWNDLFSKQLLEHYFSMPFPDFVKPSLSVWLLNWKSYIEQKFPNNFFSPENTVREMPLQKFKDEVDKLIEFFSIPTQKISKESFESIQKGLNLTIPHYYSSSSSNEDAFKNAFIASVFYLAKMTFSKNNIVQEEDLTKFFKTYYSYFYKENKSRELVFKTSVYQKDDFNKLMDTKIEFLKPKSLEEKYFFYNLDIPLSTLSISLNNVLGIKEYNSTQKQDFAILQFKNFFASIKNEVIENKLPLSNNIKTKKNKI